MCYFLFVVLLKVLFTAFFVHFIYYFFSTLMKYYCNCSDRLILLPTSYPRVIAMDLDVEQYEAHRKLFWDVIYKVTMRVTS